MRSLRALMIALGLLPALSLVAVVGLGFVADNEWQVSASVDIRAHPDDVIVLAEDVSAWREWLLIEHVSSDNFSTTLLTPQSRASGATLEWTTGFVMGQLTLVSEWESPSRYEVAFADRRAGRASPSNTQQAATPSAWTQIDGSLSIEDLSSGQVRLTLTQSGTGGPRPLGPLLVSAVSAKRQLLLEEQLAALGAQSVARAQRRRLIEGSTPDSATGADPSQGAPASGGR